MTKSKNMIVEGDCLRIVPELDRESVDLIYIDPPFNTGKQRTGTLRNTGKDVVLASYFDEYGDSYIEWMQAVCIELHHVLKPTGSFFLHADSKESHYLKVMCDEVFGRESFRNEIIWHYDYGGRSKRYWPAKHDTIFWYSKDEKDWTFDYDSIDRVPYLAPGLVGPEKAARGKVPTDVWWQTIVPTASKARTGYPTQKPVEIIERIVKIHSNPGELVLDCFAGSGTTGEAAYRHNRNFCLIDENTEAVGVMTDRLHDANPQVIRRRAYYG